jgi:hypothetical protein
MACRAISESLSRSLLLEQIAVPSNRILWTRSLTAWPRSPSAATIGRVDPNAIRSHAAAAHEKRWLGLSGFLKNNTKSRPVWQEIVDFSYRAPGRTPLTGATPAHPRRRVILSRAPSLAGVSGSFGEAPAAASGS